MGMSGGENSLKIASYVDILLMYFEHSRILHVVLENISMMK